MLQAARTASHPGASSQPGDQVKRAAQALHNALGRMEAALANIRREPPLPPTQGDEELLNQCIALEQENKELKEDLAAMQERCREVAGQVQEITARIDLLTDRLSKVLAA